MDVQAPEWNEWEEKFLTVAEKARKVKHYPNIGDARHYLCLYGDNGLNPQDEFRELEIMDAKSGELQKVEVDSSYWQDIVLFIP